MIFFLCAREYRIVLTGLIVGGFHYGIGSLVSGPAWGLRWLSVLMDFELQDLAVNQSRMVSILGFLKAFAAWLGLNQSLSSLALYSGMILAAALFLWLACHFLKAGNAKSSNVRKIEVEHLIYLTGPAMILITPHTLF